MCYTTPTTTDAGVNGVECRFNLVVSANIIFLLSLLDAPEVKTTEKQKPEPYVSRFTTSLLLFYLRFMRAKRLRTTMREEPSRIQGL